MIFRFMTKRNGNGWRRYLAIDTEKKTFCRECPRMIMDGVEVKKKDLEEIQAIAENAGFVRVDLKNSY